MLQAHPIAQSCVGRRECWGPANGVDSERDEMSVRADGGAVGKQYPQTG